VAESGAGVAADRPAGARLGLRPAAAPDAVTALDRIAVSGGVLSTSDRGANIGIARLLALSDSSALREEGEIVSKAKIRRPAVLLSQHVSLGRSRCGKALWTRGVTTDGARRAEPLCTGNRGVPALLRFCRPLRCRYDAGGKQPRL
jgi:hypothetical protein